LGGKNGAKNPHRRRQFHESLAVAALSMVFCAAPTGGTGKGRGQFFEKNWRKKLLLLGVRDMA
jgi:hypothetical protein